MEIKELGHIVLYVHDIERSSAFYRDVLGWREIASSEEARAPIAAFSSGRTHHELLLIEVGKDAAPIARGRHAGTLGSRWATSCARLSPRSMRTASR